MFPSSMNVQDLLKSDNKSMSKQETQVPPYDFFQSNLS